MISNLIDSLFGCSHKRITFPITVRHTHARQGGSEGTYVVCLDCGGEFAYDWKEMKVLGRRDNVIVVPRAQAAKAA
jgi:hypothetical protein